jgi:hypothetical protein
LLAREGVSQIIRLQLPRRMGPGLRRDPYSLDAEFLDANACMISFIGCRRMQTISTIDCIYTFRSTPLLSRHRDLVIIG